MRLSVRLNQLIKKCVKVVKPDYLYVFHHIPKCGGTSVFSALGGWFNVILDYRNYTAELPPHVVLNYGNLTGEISPPIKLDTLLPTDCLCGHFEVDGNYLHQRYPEILRSRKYKVFTFVRDPLELKISLYYYEKKLGVNDGMTLEESLFTRSNYMADRFPCTFDNYLEVLDRYFFIGVVEFAQESMDKLANLLGKPRLQLSYENKSQRDVQCDNLSAEIIDKFKKENKLDYLIYHYCCNVNKKICT